MEGPRTVYTVDEMCVVLLVSESGYRAWKQGGTPDRTRWIDAQRLALICAIHDELNGAYGARAWSGNCGGVGSQRPSRESND